MSDPRPVGNFHWTDEAVATLKRMVAEGSSYGQISRVLGCSRCAAIGKFNRAGGVRPTKASAPPKAPFVARAQFQNASLNFRSPPPRPGPISVGPTPWVDRPEPAGRKRLVDLLGGDCRFGIGDASSDDFRFCAEPVTTKPDGSPSSYCPAHHARCCITPRPKPPATEALQRRRSAA